MYEYELEALPELEEELEGEWESEFEMEGEEESEEFFRRLAGLARRAISSPTGRRALGAVRRVGLRAARSALSGLGTDVGGALGGEPGTWGARVGTGLGAGLGGFLGSLLPDSEYEAELEGEFEEELNPIRRVYADALMEHLGHAAAEAESEAEAEAFLGALIPLAARLIPRVAPTIMRAAPRLIRGVASVARTLRRSPATRQLVRTLPTVVRRTVASVAQQAGAGRPVTPRAAVGTLARQTARVLGTPTQAVRAYQRSRALDRRYHAGSGAAAGAVCPQCGGAQ